MKKLVILLLTLAMVAASASLCFAETRTWGSIVADMRAEGYDAVGARSGRIGESFEIDVDFTVTESIGLGNFGPLTDGDGNITGYTVSAVLKNLESAYHPVVIFAQYDDDDHFIKATVTDCGSFAAGTEEAVINASITTGEAAYVRAYMWNATDTTNVGALLPLVTKAKTVGNKYI